MRRSSANVALQRAAALLLAMALLVVHSWPVAAQSTTAPPTAGPDEPRVVGDVTLETTSLDGRPLHYDSAVPASTIANVRLALEVSLEAVPRLSELSPLRTPVELYVLADQERFRQALAEVGRVRVDLLGDQVGAYAIQRGETMLLFFPSAEVADPADALLLIAHELAHLAIREASGARQVPQWLNEGYAAWLSQAVLAQRFSEEGELQVTIDRAVVASALHTRGSLLPWPELVTRGQFSRAGAEGWTYLSYAQSTLFVDRLVRRHGVGGLAALLHAVAGDVSVSQAFQAELGSLAMQAADFERALADLQGAIPPGLHRLTPRPRAGQPVAFVVVGGEPGERISALARAEDGQELRTERTLDAAGFLLIWLGSRQSAAQGSRSLAVESARLGRLSLLYSLEPAAAPPAREPLPAPVQLPVRRVWRGDPDLRQPIGPRAA
jgi:hypothetical protein